MLNLPVKSILDSFLESRKSESTKKAYFKDLSLYQVFVAMSHTELPMRGQIGTIQDIFDFQKFLESAKNSPATINRRWGAIKSLFTWAAQNKLIPPMDLSSVKLPKPDRLDDTEEMPLS